MQCNQCGCEISETARTCSGCGGAVKAASAAAIPRGSPDVVVRRSARATDVPDVPAAAARYEAEQYAADRYSPIQGTAFPYASFQYATMGERFLAFLCDASIETVLIAGFLAIPYSSNWLDTEILTRVGVWVIPVAYMTLAEFLFHGTVGKRLLRLELRSDPPEKGPPTLWRILLRESAGKTVSTLLLGSGFLAGFGQRKRKTWHDSMAGTVVIRKGVVSQRFKVALVPILLCVYVGLAMALTMLPTSYKNAAANQLTATETTIEDLHRQILGQFYLTEFVSAVAYQEKMKSLTSQLDEYDRLLVTEHEAVTRSRKLAARDDPFETAGLDIYEKLIPLRKEIVVLMRQHMQTAWEFDPQRQSWAEVTKNRSTTLDEINIRNQKINQMGGIYVFKPVSLDGKFE